MGLAHIFGFASEVYQAAFLVCIAGIFCLSPRKKDLKFKFTDYKSKTALIITLIILGMLLFQTSWEKTYVLQRLNDTTQEIVGYGLSVERRSEKMIRLTLEVKETETMGALQKPEKVLVSIYDADGMEDYEDLAGRLLIIRGALQKPSAARNPNCFDYKVYLKTLDIGMLMSTKASWVKIAVNEKEFDNARYWITNVLSKAKCCFSEELKRIVPEENATLIMGMLFGDTNGIEEETLIAFQKNSTAHILSVSGLHIGIIYLFMNLLTGGRKSIAFDLAMVAFFLIYAALSSFSPSVMRAVFMIMLHLLARNLHARYDLLSATAFTAMVMLLVNPLMILNAGFQLSYLAMISLAVLMPKIERIANFPFSGAAAATLAVQIGMAPLICYHFNYFSLGGFIANIPVIFLSGFLIPIGICLMPLSLISAGGIFGVGATAMDLMCRMMTYINHAIYMDGRLSWNVISPTIMIMIAYYGVVFFGCSEAAQVLAERRSFKKIILIAVSFVLIAGSIDAIKDDPFSEINVIFPDVGQGDCLFVRTPYGKTMLIDGGGSAEYDTGSKILLPFLLKNGIRKIDLAIVTHLHLDHYEGIRSLSNELKIGSLCVYEGYKNKETDIVSGSGFGLDDLVYLKQGDRVRLDDEVFIEIIYPESRDEAFYEGLLGDPKNENDLSLIAAVWYDGIRILMTGDIDMKGERKLMTDPAISEKLKCELLKIGHHGSKYSTSDEFLACCAPKAAIFQVGRNNFGHPHGTVIEKCLKNDIMIFRNDLDGAIGIGIENGIENGDHHRIWVRSMLTER